VQAPVAGGGATILVNSQNDYPAALAVVSGQVYWTDQIQSGSVSRVPIGGGMSIPIASNLSYPSALAASGGSLFFTTQSFTSMNGGAVQSVPVGGGTPKTIANSQMMGQTSSIAVGAGNVYWTTYADVMVAPAGGGAATQFATQQYSSAVAADSKYVYWTSSLQGGLVLQQSAKGGNVVTLASNQYYPNAIVVDATDVYWTTGQGGAGTVMKVAIGGGTPITLASSQPYPSGMALNSTTLFWVDFGDGTIRAVPK
jgi:hypothetical protein